MFVLSAAASILRLLSMSRALQVAAFVGCGARRAPLNRVALVGGGLAPRRLRLSHP